MEIDRLRQELNDLLRQYQGDNEYLKIEELYDKMVELARKAEDTINPPAQEE